MTCLRSFEVEEQAGFVEFVALESVKTL